MGNFTLTGSLCVIILLAVNRISDVDRILSRILLLFFCIFTNTQVKIPPTKVAFLHCTFSWAHFQNINTKRVHRFFFLKIFYHDILL